MPENQIREAAATHIPHTVVHRPLLPSLSVLNLHRGCGEQTIARPVPPGFVASSRTANRIRL
jgi:hypothetical protein